MFCLASKIAWLCAQDEIKREELQNLSSLCDRFMRRFQSTFGVAEMKFSVHLVSHIPLAVLLYGPLQNVSCYGPEDHIGKISRKVLLMNNTAKHIMKNSVQLQLSTHKLQSITVDMRSSHDARIFSLANRVLGRRNGDFVFRECGNRYQLIGRPTLRPTTKQS